MNKYKTLLSNTALISIGTFGSKLLVFFMVRFYTGYLTPSDYGTADLITQTANLLLPIISLGIADGVFRFALDHPRGRKNVFTVGLITITLGAILFVAIVPLLHLVKEFDGYIWLIVLFTMASCYHSLCAQFVRAIGNTVLYSVQGLINTALVIGLNVLFLAYFKLGITGYVLSVALADIICTFFLIFKEKLWRRVTFHPQALAFYQMLRYSVPLIPTTIFWWVTSVSDRYMVNAYIGPAANGIYTVSYKIPTILTLLAGIFLEAWQFSAISESHGDRRAHIRFYTKVWDSFQAVLFLAGGVMVALSQWEIRILSDASYYEAWQYVPLLCGAMVFASFVNFMGSVYVVKKRSINSFWTAMLGAVLNIGLNFLLIPSSLGVQGAALATFASYFVVFVVRAINARTMIPFGLHGGRLVCSTLVLGAQVVYMVMQLPNWQTVQGGCVALLLILNIGPVLRSMGTILRLRRGE